MEAGDILAVKGGTNASPFIKFFTGSKWTHVGIAISSEHILDAIPSKKVEERADVDFVTKAKFVEGASKTIHYRRNNPLSDEQIENLTEFAKYAKTKSFTKIHAAGTLFLLILNMLLAALFLPIVYKLILSMLGESLVDYFVYFVFIVGFLMVWICLSLMFSKLVRTKYKVKEVENLFRKSRLGSRIVENKYNLFCSKLILEAEGAIDGDLLPHLPNEDEIQPKHVVKACEILNWKVVDD